MLRQRHRRQEAAALGVAVGADARRYRLTEPGHVIHSAKRFIGQNTRAPLVQLAMTLPQLRKLGFPIWKFRLPRRDDALVRRVLMLMLPVSVGLGLINIDLVLNSMIGSLVSDEAPAAIDKAFRVYMLPQGMFSVAVATVLFPTLSRLVARQDLDGLRRTQANGMRQIALLLIPAAAVTIALPEPITRLVYERGAFDAASTDQTAEALDPEGWLHTGDIAEIDEDGYVRIVDRKKEIIINAAGKNMSPANIESTLKGASPLIGQVCVIGDARPYNTALIVLDADFAPAFDAGMRGRFGGRRNRREALLVLLGQHRQPPGHRSRHHQGLLLRRRHGAPGRLPGRARASHDDLPLEAERGCPRRGRDEALLGRHERRNRPPLRIG